METPGLGEEGKRGLRRKRNLRLKPPQTSASHFHLVGSVLGTQGPGPRSGDSDQLGGQLMLLEGGVVLPFPHSAHHCLLLPCALMRAAGAGHLLVPT